MGGTAFGATQGIYFAGKDLMNAKKNRNFDFVNSSAKIFFNTVFWGCGSLPIGALAIIHPVIPLLIFGSIPLSLAFLEQKK